MGENFSDRKLIEKFHFSFLITLAARMDGRAGGGRRQQENVRACPFAPISPPIILKVR